MELTGTIRRAHPNDLPAGEEPEIMQLTSTGETYVQALDALEQQIPEGSMLIAIRTDR